VDSVPDVSYLLYYCDSLPDVIEDFSIIEFEDYEFLIRDVMYKDACHIGYIII
ncbi:15373_t:CDS:1, partial [Acaulospora colombiana]